MDPLIASIPLPQLFFDMTLIPYTERREKAGLVDFGHMMHATTDVTMYIAQAGFDQDVASGCILPVVHTLHVVPLSLALYNAR